MAALTISAEEEKRLKGKGILNNKGTDNFSARIITINGKITAEQMRGISEAAEKYGNGIVTFTTRLSIEVQGIPYGRLDEFQKYIGKYNLKIGGTGSKIRPVTSCKGTVCHYGLIDAFAISEEIHHRFYEGYADVKLPHKFKIAVGGCPNNCVKPNLNDVGIIGQMVPVYEKDLCRGCKKCKVAAVCPVNAPKMVDGRMQIDENVCLHCGHCIGNCRFDAIKTGNQGYKIYIGGRWGKQISIGRELDRVFFSKEEALNAIEKAILFYRENGKTGERFSQTIERIGFDNVQKQIISDELLERRDTL